MFLRGQAYYEFVHGPIVYFRNRKGACCPRVDKYITLSFLEGLDTDFGYINASPIRTLAIHKNGKVRTVWHFYFLDWHDFDIPRNGGKSALLKLIRMSRFCCILRAKARLFGESYTAVMELAEQVRLSL